jgi:hypothetical protein
LAIDPEDPEGSVVVEKKAMPANPFAQGASPVALIAPAKIVPEWGVIEGASSADDPPLGPVASTLPMEYATLVPYGSQNLRLTYFPLVSSDPCAKPVKYEAELAVLRGLGSPGVHSGVFRGYSTGVSNNAYVGEIDNEDSQVEFNNVMAPSDGVYTLHIAYANGAEDCLFASHRLEVNGAPQKPVRYAPTDGWGKFSQTTATVSLREGANDIKLSKGEGAAQLDFIYIDKPVIRISLSRASLAIPLGGEGSIEAILSPVHAYDKTVVWTSSDTRVATVDGHGAVSAVSLGSADVTAESATGRKAVCKVVVEKRIETA